MTARPSPKSSQRPLVQRPGALTTRTLDKAPRTTRAVDWACCDHDRNKQFVVEEDRA